MFISAVPAYGRDYRTKAEVQAAWDFGYDFLIQDRTQHGYVNKEDKPDDISLEIRYRKGTRIVVIH